MSEDKIFCKGGGCTAKLGPEVRPDLCAAAAEKAGQGSSGGTDHG